MNLIREIVLALESQPPGREAEFLYGTQFAEFDSRTKKEHVRLAKEAGLIEVRLIEDLSGSWTVYGPRLTNLGHDFAESLRSNEQMDKAIKWIKKAGRVVTIELLIAWVVRQVGE